MRQFTFDFDELPLVIEDGFNAGHVLGSAEISYGRDGSWGIESISLDGIKRWRWKLEDYATASLEGRELTAPYAMKPIVLHVGTMLQSIIYGRLTHEWRDRVTDAVNEQIAADRESELDELADMRRDLKRETL